MQISKGKQQKAQRVVVYGTEGIGKSSLAAGLGANPLFIDAEGSTGHLDVARLEPLTMAEVKKAVAVALKSDHDVIIIDTIDWVEHALAAEMLKEDEKKSIEDYGYGGGFTRLAERMMDFLKLLDTLIAAGKHVVLLGHSIVKRHEAPGDTNPYDRWELKLSKKGGPLVKEWADALLFANYYTKVVKGADKKARATGGTERYIHSERCAAFDAKNRHGLPEEMEFEAANKVPAALLAIFRPAVAPATALAEAGESPIAFVTGLIKGKEQQAISFMVSKKMLQTGEGVDKLSPENLKRIKDAPERFLAGVAAFLAP